MQKNAVKTVSFIAVATILAKIMGLVRDMFMTRLYGTGMEAAAYGVVTRLPLLFFEMTLGVAVMSTFIPVFNRYLQQDNKKRALEFANRFITLAGLLSVFICIIGILFRRQLIHLQVPGFDEPTLNLSAQLMPILMPTLVFTTLAFCFVGLLQSFDEFNIPAIISLVSNGAVILYLLFFNSRFGIYGVAVAMLVGWSLQMLIQIPSLLKKEYRYRFSLSLRDEGIRDVMKMALPILISSWGQPLSVLIITRFASYLNEGRAVPAMDYANRIYIIIVGVFAFAITNYIFPTLSQMSGSGDEGGFKKVTVQSLRGIILIIAPVMAGMLLLCRPIISKLYGGGAFGAEDVSLVSTALFFYCFGMISFSINEIANKCFYARQDGKTPMVATLCGIATTVGVSFVCVKVWHLGIGSLAFSSALGTIVSSVLLLARLHKQMGLIDLAFVKGVAKPAFAAIVMSAAVWAVQLFIPSWDAFLQIGLCVAVGALVYGGTLLLLKTEELQGLLKRQPSQE